MFLHDDVVYQILQWMPVIYLLRFKLVCRAWRALIESNDFIKQHFHLNHYDPNLKDKNHSLMHIHTCKDPPFTFPLISIDSFEEPNTCVQLDSSDLREYFPLTILDIVSYNGLVCLNLRNCIKRKYCICLWNPATKQSRVLPQSFAIKAEKKFNLLRTIVGFGFDVKNSDYKVVSLCENRYNDENIVEVYSLNTDSWRSLTDVFPFRSLLTNPRMPFNNGTCYFWNVSNSEIQSILSFDFTSNKFRAISFPDVIYVESSLYASVMSDKIACVFNTIDYRTEIWVFKEYGTVNESWAKLHTISPYLTSDRRMSMKRLSMNGNYLFFTSVGSIIIRYNVVTKEIENVALGKNEEISKVHHPQACNLRICYPACNLVEFKESMLSVGKGNIEGEKDMITLL